MRSILSLLLSIFVLVAVGTQARAERRLAFVVGIDKYQNAVALERTIADANAVSDTMAALGFEVTKVTRDVTLSNFTNAFAAFTATIEPGDLVFFYFAGHGVAVEGVNYLIPADIPALSTDRGETVVKRLALAEPDIVADITARKARVTIVVIDACRENPFPKTTTRSIGRTRGLIAQEPPQGVFSLYAAGAGQEALDGLPGNDPSPNSVFTRVFIKELVKPAMNLLDLGETVREEVAELARSVNYNQVPAVYNQVLGSRRVILSGYAAPKGQLPVETPVVPPQPPAGPDEAAWRQVQSSTDPAALRRFVQQFPNSQHRKEAEARIALLEEEAKRRQQGRPPLIVAPPQPSAEAECDKVAASTMSNVRGLDGKGFALGEASIASAIAACRSAVAGNPTSAKLVFQLARALDLAKQDQEALTTYRRAVDLGNPMAMFLLGLFHQQGRAGVLPAQAEAEAGRLYRAAADAGVKEGLTALGRLLATRLYSPRDDYGAVALFRQAAAQNEPYAMTFLAMMTVSGRGGLAKNLPEALRLFRLAAAQNVALAKTQLGLATFNGVGMPKNQQEGVRLLKEAVGQGETDAMAELGAILLTGNSGFPKDQREGLRLLRQSEEFNNLIAITYLGFAHASGIGLPQNDVEAVKYFRRAAELGSGAAAYAMAELHFAGRGGLPKDYTAIRQWLVKAVQLGYPQAATALAQLDRNVQAQGRRR